MKRSLSMPVRFAALALVALFASFAPASAGGGLKDGGPVGAPNWGGLYIAGSVGYGFGTAKDTLELATPPTTSRDNVDIDSFIGTVAVGYDHMVSSNFLVGIFGDYTFGKLDGSGERVYPLGAPAEPFDVSIDNMWSVGARMGLVSSAHGLWYVTAGYTQADLRYSDAFDTGHWDLKGYFLGAGFETMLRTGWFLRAEYRFTDYGKETIFEGGCTPSCEERERLDTKMHALRLGLVYKLGGESVASRESYK
jgi:outer membrane immunogenic protein